MFTTDAHCDTLSALAVWNINADKCCVTPERLAAGNIGLQTFAIYASKNRPDPYSDACKMMDAFEKLPVNCFSRKLPDQIPEGVNGVLSCEGGEMFRGSIDILKQMDDRTHIRLIALTWNFVNEIATPAAVNAVDGLTPFGFEFLKEMDRRGICADVSHLNEAGFWDVVRYAKVPPVASHSNCRWLCDVPRNLWKDQVKALIDREGFIGVNFYSEFLAKNREAVLDDVLRHIDGICELGGEDIVGFGSDFDGIEKWPEGLANPSDFPALIEKLRDHGYTQEQLEKIAGLNYWRLLKKAEEYIEV